MEMLNQFDIAKSEIHEALCDSIDTRTVIEKIRVLISAANVYTMEKVGIMCTDVFKIRLKFLRLKINPCQTAIYLSTSSNI
jgi:hypothetical protein